MSKLILPRRQFIAGVAALFAAPAIVRASSLMPVKSMVAPEFTIDRIIVTTDSPYIELMMGGKVLARARLDGLGDGVFSATIDDPLEPGGFYTVQMSFG